MAVQIQLWPLPEWKLVRCWCWQCTVIIFPLHRIDNVNWRFLRITVLWWTASWSCREWWRRRRCFCGMIYDSRRLLHYLPADVWSTVLYLFGSTPHKITQCHYSKPNIKFIAANTSKSLLTYLLTATQDSKHAGDGQIWCQFAFNVKSVGAYEICSVIIKKITVATKIGI